MGDVGIERESYNPYIFSCAACVGRSPESVEGVLVCLGCERPICTLCRRPIKGVDASVVEDSLKYGCLVCDPKCQGPI